MDFTNQVILIFSLLLMASVLASLFSARLGMPVLLVFLVLGMLMGEDGPGGIEFEDVQSAHLLGSLALAVILFDGGLRTDAGSFRVGLKPALSLAIIGVAFTAAITGVAATWLLNLPWLFGLLIGAIVGSTDAAAVFSVLHSRGLELKQRVGATLEIESGSNDPMAIFLTIGLVELLAAGKSELDWTMLSSFAQQFGLGGILGVAGGFVLLWLLNRLRLAAGLYPLLAMSGGMVLFGVTSSLGGSGFLAIYLAGLILGNRPLQAARNIRRFHDGIAWLSQISMFLVLGLLVTPSELVTTAPQAMAVALVLIFLARPVAVTLSLLPFGFAWREQLFVGWVGLRGAVPIILALFPLLAGLEYADTIFNIAFFVVLVSLIVQGWTVAPAARWLGLEIPPRTASWQRVDLDIPGAFEYELVGYRLEADSPATGRLIGALALPDRSRLVALIRGEQLLGPEVPEVKFEKDDHVYLLAAAQAIEALDRIFITVRTPERLKAQQFFGEFVLNGDAKLADVAGFYGFPIPDEAVDASIADYFRRRFHNQPVIGDRIRVSGVEMVVRDIKEGVVVQVGLRLAQKTD
ncbi:potassium/proton antiporter [Thiohalomonas denitrificans]|uniref:potassium/proton antiporter n=1 Tax=Thiohalomonas denitrificans TaxID=415747 RepID=UPI0026E93DDD|nr:potassium/proton antiporter [Thiohalomonas denitrificans]